MKSKLAIIFLSLFVLTGCTAISLTSEGEKIRVMGKDDVVACKHIGKTTATVTAKVAGLKRKEHIIKKELEILARNAAANMGGDTIIAVGKIDEGKQSFKVYKCRGR